MSQSCQFPTFEGPNLLGGCTVNYLPYCGDPCVLSFEASARVELIINLETADALGLTVPASLLGRADEVIE
jgi:putative tryptophan/tyrosine transport system substrate-binding protein